MIKMNGLVYFGRVLVFKFISWWMKNSEKVMFFKVPRFEARDPVQYNRFPLTLLTLRCITLIFIYNIRN